MMKSLQTACVIIIAIAIVLINTSCKKEVSSIQTQLKPYTGNTQFELLPQTVEKIFSSQTAWEARTLNYFNVIKQDSTLTMFYKSYAYNQLEFGGSFCMAQSANGLMWLRPPLNGNTNILLDGGNNNGVLGNFVFLDSFDVQYHYKMICSKLTNNEQKTFLYASVNGVNWVLEKELFDIMQDSQFSMIRMNGHYYLFARYNDFSGKYQRAVSLSILDNEFNIIQKPKLLLEAPATDSYSHIYNSAASKINDSTVLLFPTYYDSDNGSIQIKLLCTNNMRDYYLVNDNINADLFPGGGVNWAIVSPGLISTGEKDTYWLYYYGSKSKHNDFGSSPKIDVFYYRIKLVVHQ